MDRIIDRDILHALSRHLEDDKILAIRGARQTGKSTLLNLIEGVLIKNGVKNDKIN